jgi:hypothetical protein
VLEVLVFHHFLKARCSIRHIPKENMWQHSKERACHLGFDTSSKETINEGLSLVFTKTIFELLTIIQGILEGEVLLYH